MDLLELRERMATWEDIHTEFKQWPVASDEVAGTIVSLANTDGGQLILGVDSTRNIIGIGEDPDHVFQAIDNISRHNCIPPVTLVQETVNEGDRVVIVVNVPKGSARPYRTNRGRFFIRTTAGKRDASNEELRRLFQRAGSLYFDESSVDGTSVGDLDLEQFREFLSSAHESVTDTDMERLLGNLHLLDAGRATVAGLVLFGREPQRRIPEARIVAARIRGKDLAGEVIDRRDCAGPIRTLVDCADAVFRTFLRTGHTMKGFEDERRPELPLVALREFTMNAIAHRDYTVASPIRILVFDDRLEIRSPGGLPNSVTLEAMLLGAAHVLRNPTIYAFLARLGLVTDLGSGVVRSVERIRQALGTAPELRTQGMEFVVTILRPPEGGAT